MRATRVWAWVFVVGAVTGTAGAQEIIFVVPKEIQMTSETFQLKDVAKGVQVVPEDRQSKAETAFEAGAEVAKRKVGTSLLEALKKSLSKSALSELAHSSASNAFEQTLGKGVVSTAASGDALKIDNNPLYQVYWDHPDYTPDTLSGYSHFRVGASAVAPTGGGWGGESNCDPEFLGMAVFNHDRQVYPGLEASKQYRALGTTFTVDMSQIATVCEKTEAFILATQKHRAAGGSLATKPGGPLSSPITTKLALDDTFPLSTKRYNAFAARQLYFRAAGASGILEITRRKGENLLILTIDPSRLVRFPFLTASRENHPARIEFCGPGLTYRPWESLYGRHNRKDPLFQVEVPFPGTDAERMVPLKMTWSGDTRGQEWDTVFFSVGEPEVMTSRYGVKTYRIPLNIEKIVLAVEANVHTRTEGSTRRVSVIPPASSSTCGKESTLWPPL